MNDPHDNALDDKAILEKLTAMSAETESILRENAETRADLGLAPGPTALSEMGFGPGMTAGFSGPKPDADGWRRVSTSAGDVVDADTGEVLKDAPGYDPSTRTILNNEGCDWAGGRLREKQEALDECHRMHDAETKRIQDQCDRLMAAAEARLAKATAPLHRDADFLENVIRAYAETHRAELFKGRRGKTVRLPSGLVLAWRSGGGEYRWRKDMKPAEREAALLAWAQEEVSHRGPDSLIDRKPIAHAENIKNYCEVVYTDALKAFAAARTAGHDPLPPIREAPPGLEYVPEHEELTVRVESDK